MSPNQPSSPPVPSVNNPGGSEPVTPGGPPSLTPVAGDSQSGFKDIISIVVVLLSALVLAFGLISFVFQSYQVDGPSMQTTLHNDDHLIVWKVPRTWARITGHPYVPDRGDVIVFNEPGLAAYGAGEDK